LNQDDYIGNIIKNGVIALIVGIITVSILYATLYSVTGPEMYLGFIILGAIYGFLFIKVAIFENDLDLIITNLIFAFFGAYVSINLVFSGTLKSALNSSMLTYQYTLIAMVVAVVVNYIRDKYLDINPLGSINLDLRKLPTVTCPECGVVANADSVFCPECGHKFKFIHCPECGAKLDTDSTFCQECGYKLEEDSKNNCPKCGCKLAKDSKFCPECGDKIKD
jgi:putative hemolysin